MMRRFTSIANSLTTQIMLWVGGCSTAVFVIVYLSTLYYNLPVFSVTAAIIYLLVLLLVCRYVIARHMRPLRLLADSAQHIAEGHLDETVPDSGQKDEIGQLQNSFVTMQHSLSDYISDMHQKRETLSAQNEKLQAVYEQAQEAGSVKEHFLSNMTDQMTRSIDTIATLAETLCNDHETLSRAEMTKLQIQIVNETDTVTMLLDKMLSAT